MDVKTIVILSIAAALLVRKYLMKKKDGQKKPSQGLSSTQDDDYEPYSGR